MITRSCLSSGGCWSRLYIPNFVFRSECCQMRSTKEYTLRFLPSPISEVTMSLSLSLHRVSSPSLSLPLSLSRSPVIGFGVNSGSTQLLLWPKSLIIYKLLPREQALRTGSATRLSCITVYTLEVRLCNLQRRQSSVKPSRLCNMSVCI